MGCLAVENRTLDKSVVKSSTDLAHSLYQADKIQCEVTACPEASYNVRDTTPPRLRHRLTVDLNSSVLLFWHAVLTCIASLPVRGMFLYLIDEKIRMPAIGHLVGPRVIDETDHEMNNRRSNPDLLKWLHWPEMLFFRAYSLSDRGHSYGAVHCYRALM